MSRPVGSNPTASAILTLMSLLFGYDEKGRHLSVPGYGLYT